MKTIKVMCATTDIRTLYKRARTPAQRALLGYMIKTGEINNSVFGGAYNLLHGIEWCMEENIIYRLFPIEDSNTVKKIVSVAQSALDGEYDAFSFTAREIDNIIRCMNDI